MCPARMFHVEHARRSRRRKVTDMAKRSRRKGWDGTPPERTYPYAVHNVAHLWGEPGITVFLSKDGGYVTADWSYSQPRKTIIMRELVKAGDWLPYANPNGTPSEFREIDRIETPAELWDGPQKELYLWVHNALTAWATERYGADVFDPARRA